MFNIFQTFPSIYLISITLVAALILTTVAALRMIEKKRINVFLPFFTLGVGACLFSGFLLSDFFGIAADVFYVFSFISVVGIFFVLWGSR